MKTHLLLTKTFLKLLLSLETFYDILNNVHDYLKLSQEETFV